MHGSGAAPRSHASLSLTADSGNPSAKPTLHRLSGASARYSVAAEEVTGDSDLEPHDSASSLVNEDTFSGQDGSAGFGGSSYDVPLEELIASERARWELEQHEVRCVFSRSSPPFDRATSCL